MKPISKKTFMVVIEVVIKCVLNENILLEKSHEWLTLNSQTFSIMPILCYMVCQTNKEVGGIYCEGLIVIAMFFPLILKILSSSISWT